MGRSEELGTGIKNVLRYNKIYSDTDDNEFVEEDVFITSVPLKLLNDPLNNRQKEIIKLIKKNTEITKNEIALKVNVSIETIKRDFRILINNKKIKRVGSKKTGCWEIKNNYK